MPVMSPSPASLMAVAVASVGVYRASKVLAFMVAWEVARRELRRESITLQDYAEYWRANERTAYREQAAFRKAFPGEQTPDRLLDIAAAQWDSRQGVSGLGQVALT